MLATAHCPLEDRQAPAFAPYLPPLIG